MQGSSVGAPETGRDSALTSHNPANGVPTQVNAAFFQVAAYDLHELVGQYGNEQVAIRESNAEQRDILLTDVLQEL